MSAGSPAPLYLLAGRPKARSRTADPLLQRIIAQCGLAHPRIGYLGSASGDDGDFFKMISALLKNAGAGEVLLARTVGAHVDMGKTRQILEDVDAVLVSGGDVEEGMRVLAQRNLTPLLRRRYRQGTLFFGLSAGSIMLSRQWVRWRDPDVDATAEGFDCLGFAPVLCDTHGEDEDWDELRALLRLAPPEAIGYGIPSGAGLCVRPEGRPLALGEPVHRFQRRGSTITRIPDLELENQA